MSRFKLSIRRLLILSLTLNLVGVAAYTVKPGPKPPERSPRERYHRQRVSAFDFLERELAGKRLIVFAGDSMIQTFGWSEHFARPGSDVVILNRGINGDSIDQLIERSRVSLLAEHAPEKLFIMVGVNDVNKAVRRGEFSAEQLGSRYAALLEGLSDQVAPARVCVHSILPVRGRWASINPAIREVNAYLESYTRGNAYCYIDIHTTFADATGQLQERYAFEDGIHLSAEGYRLWTKILKPYVQN